MRHVFETCATFEEACRLLETAPVARPVLFTVVGCKPGERVVIERHATISRVHRDETIVANAWRDETSGWRSRCNTVDDPVASNQQRRMGLATWAGRDDDTFAWAAPPVLNKDTRLTVEMCAASGRLAVMGWEPNGKGSVEPVTRRTEF